MTMSMKRWIAAISFALVGVVAALLVSLRSSEPNNLLPSVRLGAGLPEVGVGYPDEWRVTLDQMRSGATFPVIVPKTQYAKEETATDVFLKPSGRAAIIQFPAPDGEADVRQTHLEVFQEVWSGGSPQTLWEENVKAYPGFASIQSIQGTSVLVMEPNSPFDSERSNPAFVRFVMNGIDFQISGGNDLEVLLDIARSIRSQGS